MKKKLTQLSDLSSIVDRFPDEVDSSTDQEQKEVQKPKYRKETTPKKEVAKPIEKKVVAKPVETKVEIPSDKKKGENKLYVKEFKDRESYQKDWSTNKYQFREMIAKKNRKWLQEEAEKAQFDYYNEYPDIYKKIEDMFEEESKRKWLVHIITNFLPLNKSKRVPKLPLNRKTCPFTNFALTDVKNIMVGDRDKHLAFTGDVTNVVLSGVALQEFQRFVIDCTYKFDTRAGHIVNFAIDALRQKNQG